MEIMKASAGSGKTFNLARKYISLLFKKNDNYSYKHILAVTFTNKATAEMKNRILKELYVLAYQTDKSPYLAYFMPSKGSVPAEDLIGQIEEGRENDEVIIARRARYILSNILHDYSAFTISTIDKFFQQTLKAFSREIGQFTSYQVELDKRALVTETVDRILDSLSESKPELLSWLRDSVIEQIEEGNRYKLEDNLIIIAEKLKSNQHRMAVEEHNIDQDNIYSQEYLKGLKALCKKIIADFTHDAIAASNAILDIFVKSGVDPKESNGKFVTFLYKIVDLTIRDEVPPLSASFLGKAPDEEKWFAKTKAKTFKPLLGPGLEDAFNNIIKLYEADYKTYQTSRMLVGQILGLGLAADIYREFELVLKEKNVLSIDDSNTILKNIIDGTDAPFIYEKLGVKFENFLLDEFQDTAMIQWDNFLPLLENSEAQGFDNLIVGDVKQSIYRWRDSEWSLLDSEIYNNFPTSVEKSLTTNYRSLKNIIDFNNAFFHYAADILDAQYGETNHKKIAEIYSDVSQEVGTKKDAQGRVDICFCEKDEEVEYIIEQIAKIKEVGAKYSEIAILVRKNDQGGQIANALLNAGIPVITDDSLKVKSSEVVRRLVSLLSYADNPSDTVASYLAQSLKVDMNSDFPSLLDLSEHFLRAIRKDNEKDFDNQSQYIQSFMDYLKDYISSNGNNLHGFLDFWAQKNPSISSSEDGNSIRIITVHKSKGLDFPYVILPFIESVELSGDDSQWCYPDFSGTKLEPVSGGLFYVRLSKKAAATHFAENYSEEKRMQYIDNLNLVYVAMTRAARTLHIIAAHQSATFMTALDKGTPTYMNFSNLLYTFATQDAGSLGIVREPSENEEIRLSLGHIPTYQVEEKKFGISIINAPYTSYPLNPPREDLILESEVVDVRERGRLKFTADSVDFFSDTEAVGYTSSKRLRGIVLHDILSRVDVIDGLEQSIQYAVAEGQLELEESGDVRAFLAARLETAQERGWFPPQREKVSNERSLIDVDGEIYRPDRVVETDNGLIVIDYKFGKPSKSYLRQISKYADIYRRMGQKVHSTHLWYLDTDMVVSQES